MAAGVGRSEAEWSCPNTGDGCNGILSLNDVCRGQRVITSSQLVYQPERDGGQKSQEEEDPATSWPLCCSSSIQGSFNISVRVEFASRALSPLQQSRKFTEKKRIPTPLPLLACGNVKYLSFIQE